MTGILFAAAAALFATLLGTPIAIRLFKAWGWGQRIRDEGPHHPPHAEKMGTPTMGGLVIVGGVIFGYVVAHLLLSAFDDVSAAGIAILSLLVGLAIVGFVDDLLKTGRRRSLGMGRLPKLAGQAVAAFGFAIFVVRYAGADTELSFIRPLGLGLGALFVVWAWLMITASSNAVNLTDGLDGLASGSMALVMASYVVIAFWQLRNPALYPEIENGLDLAIVAAAGMGAVSGFLWWNAAPARIFMGDTGSLALGGLIAAMAIMTNTQLLLLVLGGLYVMETVSVIMQGAFFRLAGRRVFRMAPIHHHFEVGGWPEFTVIVRFWIVAGLCVAFGLGLFYADFLARGGA